MGSMRRIGFAILTLAAATALSAPPAHAKAPWVKKAQEKGTGSEEVDLKWLKDYKPQSVK